MEGATYGHSKDARPHLFTTAWFGHAPIFFFVQTSLCSKLLFFESFICPWHCNFAVRKCWDSCLLYKTFFVNVCVKFRKVVGFSPLPQRKKWKYIWLGRNFLQRCGFSPVFQQINNFQNFKMHFSEAGQKMRFLPKRESNPFSLSAMYWYLSLAPCMVN